MRRQRSQLSGLEAWLKSVPKHLSGRSLWMRWRKPPVPPSPDYLAWRHRFFLDRLGLCLVLALVILFTFVIRDLFNYFFPLSELEQLPSELAKLSLPIDVTILLLLSTCLALYRTNLGRQRPALLFFGLSWSTTIVPQVLATLYGIPLPTVLAWSLVFLIQATLIPVRWELHLVSQLGVLFYFYGVNTLLGLTELPTFPGQPPQQSIFNLSLAMYLFWFCFICDLAVYLYERLQRAEFESRRQVQLFLHAVSHDLRNPSMGTAMVLRNLLKTGDEQITVSRSLLERMIESNQRQLDLINSLLEVQNGQINGMRLNPAPASLRQVAQGAIADLEPMVQENQATLLNQIPADLPLVNVDETQIVRIFSNLVANALHHNRPGITLTLSAHANPGEVRCSVQDDGVGMTPAETQRIFELYTRSETVRRRVGLGLGLYISRQIILAHGGTIGVTSQPGEGANFWFTLPRVEVATNEHDANHNGQSYNSPDNPQRKVLS